MMTTSKGRWPQIIKSGITQQPMIKSSSNFKIILRKPNQSRKLPGMKTTSIEGQLQDVIFK